MRSNLTDAEAAKLNKLFGYHQPSSRAVAAAHEAWRDSCRTLADEALRMLPDGREKSLVLTKLEEAMFWGNAGIAREQHPLYPTEETSTLTPPAGDVEATTIEKLVD